MGLHKVESRVVIRPPGKAGENVPPIHRGVPINPKELTGTRVTVSYDETGHRTVWRDAWTNPTRNLHDPKQIWTGWTFLELAEPREDNLGGKLEKDVGRSSVQSFPVYEKENKDGFAETPEMNTTGSLELPGSVKNLGVQKGIVLVPSKKKES